ncbi:MAG: enolase C-terminal domain-like protein [Betaproteobacteria bacterium]
MMNVAPRFRIISAQPFEREVRLRVPFRFGAATVSAAPQAFVRVRIRGQDGREAEGNAAELMIPKWFDKAPGKSNADNVDDLRAAVLDACDAYVSETVSLTAFAHCAVHYQPLQNQGAAAGRTALGTGFGGALLDRAVLDAACRLLGISFAKAICANLPGVNDKLAQDLRGFDLEAFLGTLVMPDSVAVRHTVGMLDALTHGGGPGDGPDDGLPSALDDVIARYGVRHFKLKLRGDPTADIERLAAIAAVLDPLPDFAVTLDGNEQFPDGHAVTTLFTLMGSDLRLHRLTAATLYLEQPLPRGPTLTTDASPVTASIPLLIDESDATYEAFPLARDRGYTGVSSKSCKGIYKSIANAARCAQWNAGSGKARYFLSAEDLTTQAGLAVQQDTALAALLGMTHIERNGHHYVNGFAGQGASAAEQQAFLAAHADLYHRAGDNVRLSVQGGQLSLGSLHMPGFAANASPDFASMSPLRVRAMQKTQAI